MKLTNKTVMILGAGFTKAFLPEAPLLIDDYNCDLLLKKYSQLQHAKKILENEINRDQKGKIDIERLLTRLHGQMPYDKERHAEPELMMLLSELKLIFSQKIKDARKGVFYKDELITFAELCLLNGISFITFNYDDILDQALWEVKQERHVSSLPYWHPDGGYGFFCRPSEQLVADYLISMDKTEMLLLKLHGSMNWRIRRGYESPLSFDALVHKEEWLPRETGMGIAHDSIDIHLEPDPFIIPPLLAKDLLMKQPIIKLLWSLAYEKLSEADNVIFIGYSLPATDMASTFLFNETINPNAKIEVVNLGGTPIRKKELIVRYKKLFPKLTRNRFIFKDARLWCEELVKKNQRKKNL